MQQSIALNKMTQLTAVIEREDDGYVSACQELDIVSQGGTVEEARQNLIEAVEGFFEVASPSEIRRRLKREIYVLPIMPVIPSVQTKNTERSKRAKAETSVRQRSL